MATQTNVTPRAWQYAALATVVVAGVPLAFASASAFRDGTLRAQEAPLRVLVGDSVVEAWQRGERTPEHYVLAGSGPRLSAPDVTFQTERGPVSLASLRGKVVVLNFWTQTCAPCLEEMPSLELLAQHARIDGRVEVLAVSTDRDWDTVHSVVRVGSPLRVALDPQRQVVRGRFGTRLFPETWVVDSNGIVVARIDGARDLSSPVFWDLLMNAL